MNLDFDEQIRKMKLCYSTPGEYNITVSHTDMRYKYLVLDEYTKSYAMRSLILHHTSKEKPLSANVIMYITRPFA